MFRKIKNIVGSINALFLKDWINDASFEIKHKIYLVYLVCITGVPVLFLLGFFNIVRGPILLGIGNIVVGGVFFLLLVMIRQKKWAEKIPIALVAAYFFFCILISLMEDDTRSGRLLWIFLFPLLAVYLAGNKKGLIISAFMGFFMGFILFDHHMFDILPVHYSVRYAARYLITYFFITILTLIFEWVRKRIRRELKQTNIRLVENAHLAGKAELAAEVLHNVGNTINSAGMDSEILKEALKRSRLAGIWKVLELLKTHEGQEDVFFHSEKGKSTIKYIRSLAVVLQDEHEKFLEIAGKLTGDIKSVRDVLAFQEELSSVPLFEEKGNPVDLFSTLLNLKEEILTAGKIKVDVDFISVPHIHYNPFKLIQILYILLEYSIENLKETPVGKKRIKIAVSVRNGHVLIIEMKNNGPQLSGRKLEALFNSPPRGEGRRLEFALHHAANLARSFGGYLSFDTPGENWGACFILEIPFKQQGTTVK